MDGVMEDYEDVALEGSDGVVLTNFVKAQTAIEENCLKLVLHMFQTLC